MLRRGGAAVGSVAALGVAEEGQRGLFPLGRPRGVHTRARWCGAVGSRRGAMQSKGEKWRRRQKRELTRGSHMSAKEKKTEEGTGGLGCGVSGLLGLAGLAG
jgi:hypothetical protein